jgi:phosphoribosylformylglycinamidine synthase
MCKLVHGLIAKKQIVSAYAVGRHGIAEAISKMAFGNKLGVKFNTSIDAKGLFEPAYGSIIAEMTPEAVEASKFNPRRVTVIGKLTDEAVIKYKSMILSVDEAIRQAEVRLETVYPTKTAVQEHISDISEELPLPGKVIYISRKERLQPQVFIPVFPGTNTEYDTAKAFENVGATVNTVVLRNHFPQDILESVKAFKNAIAAAQIIMFPGGFSAGDEPDGAGKFFAAMFRNPRLSDAVNDLLERRDGLILGICNGFQALIKLGLVPGGAITVPGDDAPTLTTNTIGRHVSKMVYTKVMSTRSPWLAGAKAGEVYTVPVSHGEGRFVASSAWLRRLDAGNQIATCYVDVNGTPTMSDDYNPNGSYLAIEGITSPDGRIFGKMAHNERLADHVAINVPGARDMKIFESGVRYFNG